jgi:predicted DNA-binding transcriptional regulator AlpA
MSKNHSAFERLINDHEVAAMVGVSVATVRRWRLLRSGPRYLRIGVLIRYRPESIRQWLDARPTGGATDSDGLQLRAISEDSRHA